MARLRWQTKIATKMHWVDRLRVGRGGLGGGDTRQEDVELSPTHSRRPDSGLGFEVQVLNTLYVVPTRLGSGCEYRGTSLIRNCFLLGPCSRPMPRGVEVSYERGTPVPACRRDPRRPSQPRPPPRIATPVSRYRDTSLIRNSADLGPYIRAMHRALWWSQPGPPARIATPDSCSRSNHRTGSCLRLIDSCITQLKAQGPSRTCKTLDRVVEAGGGSVSDKMVVYVVTESAASQPRPRPRIATPDLRSWFREGERESDREREKERKRKRARQR